MLLLECGFVDYHVRDVIRRRTEPAFREVMKDREDTYEEPRVLSLKPLLANFVFLILGLFISTIVFILEVLSFTGPKKFFTRVLMDIKKNRKMSNFRKRRTNHVVRRFKFKRWNVWCIFATNPLTSYSEYTYSNEDDPVFAMTNIGESRQPWDNFQFPFFLGE